MNRWYDLIKAVRKCKKEEESIKNIIKSYNFSEWEYIGDYMLKKLKGNYFGITVFSIVIICILYTILNFRGHIVIRDNKVVGYKWGIVERVKRDMIITIPEGTTEIMDGAFIGSLFMVELYIPKSVKVIHSEAFRYCINLKKIHFSESLAAIEDGAFGECASLETIELPSSVTNIGKRAFANCVSLEKVVLPENLKVVELETFDGCENLKYVNLGNVEIIKNDAFSRCNNIIEMDIPDSITQIGENSFEETEWFKRLPINSYGLKYYKHILFKSMDIEENIIIPYDITVIAGNAFQDSINLKRIVLPEDLKSIGNAAFADCINLKDVFVPESIEYIGSSAFSDCKSLTEISIPESIVNISNYAFSGCEKLKM